MTIHVSDSFRELLLTMPREELKHALHDVLHRLEHSVDHRDKAAAWFAIIESRPDAVSFQSWLQYQRTLMHIPPATVVPTITVKAR